MVAEVTLDVFRKNTIDVSRETFDSVFKLKEKAEELYDIILSLGESREISIAKTKLEESVMWAVKHATSK